MDEDFAALAPVIHTPKRAENCLRYINDLFCNYRAEEIALDKRVIRYLAITGETSEGKLANRFDLKIRDQQWEACLNRLNDNGMITRETRKWGHRNFFIDLSDEARKVFLTNKGLFIGKSQR